jgi:hypothetical protein
MGSPPPRGDEERSGKPGDLGRDDAGLRLVRTDSVGGRRPATSQRAPPEPLVLLAVDQEFAEGAALRVAPVLADPLGALEVGEHEDVEQLGTLGGGPGWVQSILRRR